MAELGADAALKILISAQMVNTDDIVDEVKQANERIVRSTQGVAGRSPRIRGGRRVRCRGKKVRPHCWPTRLVPKGWLPQRHGPGGGGHGPLQPYGDR